MNDGVHTHGNIRIDVCGGGVLDGDAGRHQFGVLARSQHSAHGFEVLAVVDSENLVGIRHSQRFDSLAAVDMDRDEIRQIVFALHVRRGDAAQGLEEAAEGERIDSRVDFTNGALVGCRVPFFDDPCNSLAVPNDSPISRRSLDHRRHNCGARRGLQMAI